MSEIVYILLNPAMPGYTKIGRTNNLEQRIRSLDNTATPLPFECFYAAKVRDSAFVERQLHNAFSDHRTRMNREFFEVSPERIVAALKLAEIEDVTPKTDYVETKEDEKALEKARKRRSAFNFKLVGIEPGSVLTFSRDQTITCKVIDDRNVEFEGRTYSLSKSASEILSRKENAPSWVRTSVQGPLYWEFENESLEERRLRLESE